MTEEKIQEKMMQKEESLNEKISDLTRFCLENQIPFFLTCALEENDNTKYVNKAITPMDLNVSLTNDRITKYAASLNENLVLKFKNSSPKFFAGDEYESILEEDFE